MTLGISKVLKNLINAGAMVLVVVLRKGLASGYFVLEHIMVNKNLFPFLVLGRGPTQSIITLENGSLVIGMGFNGADGIFRFGLPTS